MKKTGYNEFLNDEDLKIKPIATAETIPSAWYTGQNFFEFDTKAVFTKTWQHVGYCGQILKQGDYFVTEVADNPLIVVRDKEKRIRAFYNVCLHRGGPVATKDGNTKVFQCRYHGWTYDLDGKLRGTPEFEGVDEFEKRNYCLAPIRVEEWGGMLFICLDDSVKPFETFIPGIGERILPNKLESKIFHKRVDYTIKCNWKVYVDNYLEGYHLNMVHPGLAKILDYRNYVTETNDHYSLQQSPFKDENGIYGSPDDMAYYYFVFPNFMMNILPGRLQTNLVIPVAHNETHVRFDYYYDEMDTDEANKFIEDDLRISDEIQAEDIDICEHVQKGLRSDAYDKGRFSVKREECVYHFQCLLKKAYKSAF